MQDHVLFGPTYQIDALTGGSLANPAVALEQATLYAKNRTGLFSSGGGDFLGTLISSRICHIEPFSE